MKEQQEFNNGLRIAAKQKGWFVKFLIEKLLPFLWDNRSFILEVLKNKEEQEPVNKVMGSLCNKHAINDDHYGELGEYDGNCVWHPWS